MPVRDGGDFVDQVSAVKAWAQAAHDVLLETAGQRGTIEYGSLARQVQHRSGISTKQPVAKWIGPLLGVLARQCHQNKLPLMTAMVVRRDGSVGPAYDEVLKFARIPAPVEDREDHALEQRELCYRRWRGLAPATTAADPTASGVAGASTAPAAGRTATKAKPASSRAAKAEPLQGNVCPRCFMQMSLTGICDNCD